MPDIVIIGGGVVGLGLGILLADDGHGVTVLERDGQPVPETAEEAWESWDRKGVNQFRFSHFFVPRFRQILDQDLPQVAASLERDGAPRYNPISRFPSALIGEHREGDGRFALQSGRRAIVEHAVASVAAGTAGLTVRRGVAVAGLLTGPALLRGVPQVTGVRLADGGTVKADLVVDCSGRRSSLADWLESAGAAPPHDEVSDSGFRCYGRHFRSRDGQLPVPLGPGIQDYGSITALSWPADNNTWSVTLVAAASDRALWGLHDAERWRKVVQSLPTVAHWLEGDAMDDRVLTTSKMVDRRRDLSPGGTPVATGIVAVADAWACTNPSAARGASMGMLHARTLRDTLRQVGPERPLELSEVFAEETASTVEPWLRSTLSFDRHRLAEMAAHARGEIYEPGDPRWEIIKAFRCASVKDPDLLRAFMDIMGMIELPAAVLARPGLFEKVIELGANWRYERQKGPDRRELVEIVAA